MKTLRKWGDYHRASLEWDIVTVQFVHGIVLDAQKRIRAFQFAGASRGHCVSDNHVFHGKYLIHNTLRCPTPPLIATNYLRAIACSWNSQIISFKLSIDSKIIPILGKCSQLSPLTFAISSCPILTTRRNSINLKIILLSVLLDYRQSEFVRTQKQTKHQWMNDPSDVQWFISICMWTIRWNWHLIVAVVNMLETYARCKRNQFWYIRIEHLTSLTVERKHPKNFNSDHRYS